MNLSPKKSPRPISAPPRLRGKKQPSPKVIAIHFRPYQQPIFDDRTAGVIVLHWSRQIGKSFILAAWAVDRLMTRPGRLVTVLSNSRDNGAEFLNQCKEICRLNNTAFEDIDNSLNLDFEGMRLELRIRVKKKTSRIKVLAANPRTARGFSGDLILDEFAFHENSAEIWEAAEPILASNSDFLCRIASTGNGKHNMFYRLAAPAKDGVNHLGLGLSQSGFVLSRVSRTLAYSHATKIFDPVTRAEISPEAARAAALDKRAYDQNYECSFADENLTLLSHELISAAEHDDTGEIAERDWTPSQLARLHAATGQLYLGFDVARKSDLSVITVIEKSGQTFFIRAILRIRDMRLPDQQLRLGEICRLPKFHRAAIDMTGLGLGLFEYAQKEFGVGRIHGINFATTVPATRAIQAEGRKHETVRVTEALALELLQAYEHRRIHQPADALLRDDLRKPERIVTPGGRVSIAATRDTTGHADHFWSLALAIEAAATSTGPFAYEPLTLRRPNSL
ncbi:MAG TPA: terminase family protein [Verrucomicrobiae bacterium]|jgi:phage FluMu gp28-like protein|nr:terminase family protein [Verrucomicrobiae bacterium]